MIITKSTPYTKEEIKKLRELFDEIQNPKIRKEFEELTKYFFKELYE